MDRRFSAVGALLAVAWPAVAGSGCPDAAGIVSFEASGIGLSKPAPASWSGDGP